MIWSCYEVITLLIAPIMCLDICRLVHVQMESRPLKIWTKMVREDLLDLETCCIEWQNVADPTLTMLRMNYDMMMMMMMM